MARRGGIAKARLPIPGLLQTGRGWGFKGCERSRDPLHTPPQVGPLPDADYGNDSFDIRPPSTVQT